MVIVVTGAAGSGKTTVGRTLAATLGWRFVDADDRHTPANIARMRAGQPLTDADRAPWLESLHDTIAVAIGRRESLVVACSALKEQYRQQLRGGLRSVRFIYLHAEPALLRDRLAARTGHFAGPALLASQLRDLEPPADALVLPADAAPESLVAAARREFGV
jgi:gluconokinase